MRCLSTIELVNALEQEKLNGKQGRVANRLVHVDLLILDELGYLPFSQVGGALLFHLLSKLYENNQPDHHHQLELLGMAKCVWRCQADNGTVGSTNASLPYLGDRQRQLSTEELGNQQRQGAKLKKKTKA